VTGLVGEINGEACENGVHRFDPSEPPTAVHAETTGGQLQQWFHMPALNFPGRRQFFKFLSHKDQVLARFLEAN
jgi:hypothetical protein